MSAELKKQVALQTIEDVKRGAQVFTEKQQDLLFRAYESDIMLLDAEEDDALVLDDLGLTNDEPPVHHLMLQLNAEGREVAEFLKKEGR